MDPLIVLLAIYCFIGFLVGPTAVSYLKFGDTRYGDQIGCFGLIVASLFWPLCWILGLLKEMVDPFFRA